MDDEHEILEGEIEAAIYGYFESDDRVCYSTGRLRRIAEVWRDADEALRDADQLWKRSSRLALRSMRFDHVDSRTARTDVEGVLAETFRSPTGEESTRKRFITGPVTLEREVDGWKVVDFRMDGRSAATTSFPDARGRQSSGDADLHVRGAALRADGTTILADVTAPLSAEFRPSLVAIGTRRGAGWRWRPGWVTLALLPGESGTMVFSQDRPLPADTRRLRLCVRTTGGASFDVRIELEPDDPGAADEPQPAAKRLPLWLPIRSSRLFPLGFAVSFAVAVGFLLSWTWAGIALALPALRTVYVIFRKRQHVPRWRQLFAIYSCVALAGVGLAVWSSGIGRDCPPADAPVWGETADRFVERLVSGDHDGAAALAEGAQADDFSGLAAGDENEVQRALSSRVLSTEGFACNVPSSFVPSYLGTPQVDVCFTYDLPTNVVHSSLDKTLIVGLSCSRGRVRVIEWTQFKR